MKRICRIHSRRGILYLGLIQPLTSLVNGGNKKLSCDRDNSWYWLFICSLVANKHVLLVLHPSFVRRLQSPDSRTKVPVLNQENRKLRNGEGWWGMAIEVQWGAWYGEITRYGVIAARVPYSRTWKWTWKVIFLTFFNLYVFGKLRPNWKWICWNF